MEIVRKLLLGVCLLSSIQFFCINAGVSEYPDAGLGKDEFEVIIHDEQFMHYFVTKGLNTNDSVSEKRKKIKDILVRGIPAEHYISDFPKEKSELEVILYDKEFGITEFSGDEQAALENTNIFNQQLNNRTVDIHEFTNKEVKIEASNTYLFTSSKSSAMPEDVITYHVTSRKNFKSVLKYSTLYLKIGKAVLLYLDNKATELELPHFYVKIKVNIKNKTFTVQAAPNHDQSAFTKTYDDQDIAEWIEERSCLTNCLECLLI